MSARDIDLLSSADRVLTNLTITTGFLLNITPTNSDEAFEAFAAGRYRETPILDYRPLPFDPAIAKRTLFEVRLEDVEDETIAQILEAKRAELDVMLTLLSQRDTEAFLHGSIALHGAVEDELLETALKTLARLDGAPDPTRGVTAEEFARRATAEIEAYGVPDLTARVEVRPDITGLMVVYGDLMVGASTRFRAERVEPLIQHEVGTHVVTHHNGSQQPLGLLAVGLAHYEETQEALAVFSEYVVGGLDSARIGLLAERVVAARRVSEGAGFAGVFEELVELGADERSAWNTTLRAFRCGGTTKDAIYLRGLVRFLEYLQTGRALAPLLVGKLPLEDVLLIEELLDRGWLTPPALVPRWLAVEGAEDRLGAARDGLTVEQMLEAS